MRNIFQKGSVWRKWDLHVHTPASALEHSFGDNWDVYVEHLIDAANSHGVSAIVTADYFTISGYEKMLEYYKVDTRTLSINDHEAEIYLVPGVELRLNIFNSQEESINLHLFFDPDHCSCDFIMQNFLEELTIYYRGSDLPLKQQNLLAIGKSIADGTTAEYGQDFTGLNDSLRTDYIKKALRTITLSYTTIDAALRNIKEIFEKKPNLPPKAYMIAVVGKGHGGLSTLKWFEDNKEFSRIGLVREYLTYQADIIFSNNIDDRNFYLVKRTDTPTDEIENRFSNLKPCVWGSDAHSFDKLLHPSNGNTFDYTWIKADVTFEGLKQIVYEPELRIRVQKDDPSEEETFAKIEKLEIDFPNDLKIKDDEARDAISFCIQGKQEIYLSSYLTCVIGGRGSGKSTLIHILYNLMPDRDIERLLNVNSPLFNLELGAKDRISKLRSITISDVPSSTEFFLQNEVEKFAKDANEMSILIRSRLFRLSSTDDSNKSLKQIEEEWQDAFSEVNQLIAAHHEIASKVKEIELLEKDKMTLKKQTDVIKSEEYKNLQREIEEISTSISEYEKLEKEYSQITQEITKLIKNINRLDWSKYDGQSILNSLVTELENKKGEINTFFEGEKEKYEEEDYTKKLNDKTVELKQLLKKKGLSPENIIEVSTAAKHIADLENQINTLKNEQVPYQEIVENEDDLFNVYKDMYGAYRQRYEEVISILQKNLSNLKFDEQDAKIYFNLKTNIQLMKDEVSEFIKESNHSKVTLRSDIIQNILFGSNGDEQLKNMISDSSKIIEAINNSEAADVHTEILQDMISDPIFVKKLHLRIKQHYYDIRNIQVQTKLGEKLLQNTSFGERCGIVIAIALVAGTNPIIIDQPEDNLDGRYISNVLVPLIRQQKQTRQIIMVTRDANIAIGGDSELMVILDKEPHNTVFMPAAIENKSLRLNYIWILDGGERAFQKREEKYSLQR